MNVKTKPEALGEELIALERCLKQLDLWSAEKPDEVALKSDVPFCYDTLALHEWLQWILIPKFSAMIEDGTNLPDSCDISSYAELYYENDGKHIESKPLLESLKSLDACVSQKLH